ncbi:hypothetical protein IP78_11990 [Brevundimonas sp. AAP58]|uniref:hypothetical protein n=1 Tax=Brevundimonas sp. AAP58 TaxID=1523422 RepID=UPI0006B9148E|nr:hypothetical protein [Brevundimonas sp. AAP58]KPF77804.1 hypothetical protein IP78_11990 [Brevundimonas sp. AAP58]
MLEEPQLDAGRLALDRALIEALTARIAAGAHSRADARALALREALRDADPLQARILRAVHGRMEVAGGRRFVASGPISAVLAADRWGAATPVADAETALGRVDPSVFALIDLGDRPWWGRLLARPDLRVVGALPDDRASAPRALLIACETTGPTGDDRTFWVTDSPLSDARVRAELAALGLAATLLTSAGGLKLYALAGYVQPEDGRLHQAPGALSGVIGSAPVY